jgi:hypothetical protein
MNEATSSAILVAFGVVVLTTLGNTLLEWFRQHLTNRHDAEALRRALLEELRQAKETTDTNFRRTSEIESGGSFLIPVPERYPIYDANIGNLGRLRPARSPLLSALTLTFAQKSKRSPS